MDVQIVSVPGPLITLFDVTTASRSLSQNVAWVRTKFEIKRCTIMAYSILGAYSDTCTFQNATNLILLLARKMYTLALR